MIELLVSDVRANRQEMHVIPCRPKRPWVCPFIPAKLNHARPIRWNAGATYQPLTLELRKTEHGACRSVEALGVPIRVRAHVQVNRRAQQERDVHSSGELLCLP